MINAHHDKAGRRLILTADNESRAALADAYRRNGWHGMESEVAEALHEAYLPVGADDAPDAWLCDSPFLIDADGVNYCDNGQLTVWESNPIFQFPDSAIRDPWEELKNRGRTEFVEVTAEPDPDYLPPSPRFIRSHFTGGAREGVIIWIGETTFPGLSYQEVLRRWPELARYPDDPESGWDCGLYFWRNGQRFGPYSSSPRGTLDAEKDGGRFAPRPEPEPIGKRLAAIGERIGHAIGRFFTGQAALVALVATLALVMLVLPFARLAGLNF